MALATGNPYLDALGGTPWSKTPDNTINGTLSLAFYLDNDTSDGHSTGGAWSDGEEGAFWTAIDAWASVANISFYEVGTADAADIIERKVTNAEIPGLLGNTNFPDQSTHIGQYNTNQYWTSAALQQGGYTFETLVHELGHAIGLAHPHDDGDNGDGTGLFPGVGSGIASQTGDNGLNSIPYTVMSYNEAPGSNQTTASDRGFASTPLAFDIATVQLMYGAVAHNDGDTVYTLRDDGPGTSYSCIWDTSGVDTIEYDGTRNATIDLRAATLTDAPNGGGFLSQVDGVKGGFTIAADVTDFDHNGDLGVVIERAIGGGGNDRITGNEASNLLEGRSGNDILNGGQGFDTLIGGAGNDTYILVDVSPRVTGEISYDAVIEDPDGGIDTVRVGAVPGAPGLYRAGPPSYTLPDNVENGVIIGDRAFSLTGNDLGNTLNGNDADNTLTGGGGNDILHGNGGYDTLIGGTGNDTYILVDVSPRVTGEISYDAVIEDPDGGIDTVRVGAGPGAPGLYRAGPPSYTLPDNVENGVMIGDRAFSLTGNDLNNILTGNDVDNTLDGGSGNDTLIGGGGNDTLIGGPGNDTYTLFDEGERYDTVVEDQNGGIDTIRLEAVLRSGAGGALTPYTLPDNVENVIGGSGKNILTGNAGSNSLTGGGDDDTLDGGAGNDTLTGSTGNNTFSFDDGWGHDVITDFIHTKLFQFSESPSRLGDGTGHDLIDMTNVTGLHSMSQLTISDTQLGAVIEFGTNSILLQGVKAGSLTASDFSFTPSPLGQTVDATAFWGGTLTGTPGAGDTASFASSSAGIYVDLATGVAETDDVSKTEQLTSIENVTGSLTGMNSLHGDQNDNILIGGDNFNWFYGGGGNNTLIGGGGVDLADYFGTNGPVTIDLPAGKVYHGNYVDTVTSIEQFRGTTFGDIFTGDAADNYFLGEGGNNKISGGAGNDWLEVYSGNNIMDGGSSNDKLVAGTGNDVLTGGSDADTFVFGAHGAGHTEITDFNVAEGDRIDFSQDALVKQMSDVTIADDGHGNAMLSYSVSGATGTVVLDHVAPIAVTAADFLHFAPPPLGQTVDATAFWGGTLTGTPGAGDTASFASSSAGIYVDLATGVAETDDVSKTEQLTSIENVTGSLTGMNSLHGDQNDNILVGGDNFNWFYGGGGNNTLIGGGGVDLADYFGTNGPVTIDLPAGKVYHGNYVDTVTSIEQFRGTTFGDIFTGDAADNYFLGEGGNNKISGGAGNDWLEVYSGNNIMDGGSSNDKLVAGTGNDVLTGGSDADTFVFGAHGAGHTEITDFNVAEGDRIDFSQDALVKQMSDVTVTDDGHGNTMLSYSNADGTGTVVLDHIAAAAVNQNMFVF